MEKIVLKPPNLIFKSSIPNSKYKNKNENENKNKLVESDMQKKQKQIKDLINNLIHTYDLQKLDIDCFKILIKYFTDIDSLKYKIYEDFSFNNIIQFMYSKCSTKLNTSENKKILDYINYEEYEIEDSETSQTSSYERNDEIDRIFYNIDRIDRNIDFDILGLNATCYHKPKKRNNNNNNIKYNIDILKNNFELTNNNFNNNNDLVLEEIEEEFENIEL